MAHIPGESMAFGLGFEHRIAESKVSNEDCTVLAQALTTVGVDTYSEEVIASWSVTVVQEFREAVEAARAVSKSKPWEGWHVYSEKRSEVEVPDASLAVPFTGGWAPLEVIEASFTSCQVSHSSRFPGSANTITLEFMCNTNLGPAVDSDSQPSWLEITGLSKYASYTTEQRVLPLTGSAAPHLTGSPGGETMNAMWNSSGQLLMYIESVLPKDQLHTVSFVVNNPREGAEPPQLLTLAARGSVEIHATSIDRASGEVAEGEALRIVAPRFLKAKIRQSEPVPGALNTITVTFSMSIGLKGEQGQRIVISGLTGSQTQDSEEMPITDVGASGVEDLLGTVARWRRLTGVLELNVIGESVPGAEYSFSFVLVNPSAAQRAPEVYIAAPGTQAKGRRMELDVQAGQEPIVAEASQQRRGVIEETDARLPEEGHGWYETYASHLRSQYPELFGLGKQESKSNGKLTHGVLIGLSADFRITCIRDTGRDLRIRWHRLGASRLAEQAPVFILQVAAEMPGTKSYQGYRTVYSGTDTSCTVPMILAPPGVKVRIRMREEVLGHGGKLLTSPWSTIHDLEPERVLKEGESVPLCWSSESLGYGVRLSSGKHAMRRDDIPGWAGALAEGGAVAGKHAFRLSFMGRAERIAVGIATDKIPLDQMPTARFWDQEGGRIEENEIPADYRCVVWMWDGSFLSVGRKVSGKGGGDEYLCIEGDTVGVIMDLDKGQVHFYKGSKMMISIPLSRAALDCGPWYPFACSGGTCTVAIEPF